MPKFNVQQCPVCDSEKFSPFLTSTDFFVTGEEFNLKKCTSCGFIITENIEDEANIGRYYQSEEYISHSNTSKGLVNALYHQVRNYMLGRKRRLVEKAVGAQNGQILDIGTGTGYFLNEMKRFGWKVTGTEKSTEARDFAKKEFNLNIKEPDELFRMPKNTFHVITLWHVLEHIHKLDENMNAFSQLLKTEGKLIIAVPNPTSYDARHYQQFWAAYDVPRHIWHFGPEQMKQFGEKYGFRLAQTATMPFDSFYVSLLSEKYKKSKAAFVRGMFHGKISWIKSLINTSRCSSVIYFFEKQ
jgi:2-polyprenyl-3-methyl-5-hydroxy-6-metoxy-1,4-benzoquinol methylase